VRLLMKDPRVDPTARNFIALRGACQARHTKVIQELIKDERVHAYYGNETNLNILLL
jgi:hypothetical protein